MNIATAKYVIQVALGNNLPLLYCESRLKRLVSQTCAWKSLHPKNGHRLAFSRYLSTHSFTLQPCSVDHFSAMRSVSALKGVEKVAVRLTKVLSLLPSPFKSSPSSVILDLSWSPSLLNYSIHNFNVYFVPNSREKFC